MTNKKIYDFIIVGGGIVGVSTALTLIKQNPSKKILLLEKEKSFAHHQTGHNSGVIHAGVYYEPGSLKAEFCREGLKETIAFCNTHGIPYEQCGKLLVATNEIELQIKKNNINPVNIISNFILDKSSMISNSDA